MYYIVEIDDDSSFVSIDHVDSNVISTSHQISSPLSDGAWYWRVSAVNDSGQTTGFAENYRMLIVDTQPPAVPALLDPAEDSTLAFETQDFSWSPVAAKPGTPVKYRLQVSVDSTFATTEIDQSGLTTNSYTNSIPLTAKATYYWRVEPSDEAGNSGGYTPYRRFFTEPEFLCGDANADGFANVTDAVYLVNYIFNGGSAPTPPGSGDANCDQFENVTDAVYLVAYIFNGGPAPCEACP